MSQTTASRCYYCGSLVDPQRDDYCPDCHYPASLSKEEAYLTSALASLQQAMSYGGAQLKVAELFQRYQKRLRTIQKVSAAALTPTGAPEAATPASVKIASVVYSIQTPDEAEVAAPPVPAREPRQVFSWRSFFADQAINIVASLGAFLILVGALSFVATTTNLLLAFLMVFVVHAVFGITGIVTHRFASFRIVASIYTIIFALLVPLVGFSAYRLVGGNELALSVPVLIAFSAIYGAIIYTTLALFQRYALFAYFGIAALAVADLATANTLGLAFWWWPSMLMILALISLVSIARSPRLSRIFGGNRAILRQPVRIFMYVFVIMGTIGMVVVTLYSVVLDGMTRHSTEAGYAILCLSLLRLVWSVGGFYFARRTRGILTLALLFLVCTLASCYALQFDATGYALALTMVALLYGSISRLAAQLLQPVEALELQLDLMALGLVVAVPFIVSPDVPLQLVMLVYAPGAAFQATWETFAGVAAMAASIVLTISIAFKRTHFYAVPRQAAWRWLLLLAAFLFTYAHGLAILTLHLNPVWSFLGASVALLVGAVLARRGRDDVWADPLDVSALLTMLMTLGLSLYENLDVTGRLLLFYFAASYAVLFYQRRPKWLFVPTIFAIGAMLLPNYSFWTFLFLTPALALLAVVMRRFAGNAWSVPLAILALLAGILTGYTGFTQQHLEATAIALLAFAIISYAIGIIEDSVLPAWLTPFFATWSLIVSAGFLNDLVRPLVVAIVAAALDMAVSLYQREYASTGRPHRKLSALPLYATAFFAALLSAFWPQSSAAQSMTIAYCMLGFTAIALVILLVERIPELLVFPVGCAAGAIWLWYPRLDFTSLMIAYTGLCVLVFATQFMWRVLPARKGRLVATTLHEVLGIGGQALVVLVILSQNGFFANAGTLAQVGPGALLVLAALIFFYGVLRPHTAALSLPANIEVSARLKHIQLAKEVQRRCYYMAGLLLSLVVSWELPAFQQTRLDVLLLAPASYLTVIAPFLMRDSVMRERRVMGHTAAVLGACLLLLPALWFSFNDGNFFPTAILLGESLALLILGMVARVRIFILSSAGLMIVGTLRALFLATPPSLTLMLTGVTLLVIATALILTRHKLQTVWKQWE